MRARIASVAVIAAVVLATAIASAAPSTVAANPQRDAFYGDLHLHTSYSLDAYLGGAMRVDPDTAYRFARGEVVAYLGQPMQRREALDFLAVTDHAENLAVVNQLDDPESAFSLSPAGKALRAVVEAMMRADGRVDIEELLDKPRELAALYALSQDFAWGRKNKLPPQTAPVAAAAWARTIEHANRNYLPGRFTTFIAYEWTAAAHGANLHRNVIFRGASAPAPFTSWDSRSPEDLWDWLAAIRAQGFDALAIPHNSNASDGQMFAWLDSGSGYLDRAWAAARQANEPLAEISQNKGTSETHPLLSPDDEFADYEIFDYMEADRRGPGRAQGSYLRDALGRGLLLHRELGTNPYRYGFVGASDLHSGLSISAQADYAGSYYQPNIGTGRPTQAEAASILSHTARRVEQTRPTMPGSLTGVWAERNTRESIHDALWRRETFATTGTRLKFRLFGGWEFSDALLRDTDWIRRSYRDGVAMGGELRAAPANGHAPTFVAWAVKDPKGGNLDRLQLIKVWEQNGEQKEHVFDIAWAGQRAPDPDTGKLPVVGNSVDLATGSYTDAIGAAELQTVWRDPGFDPARHAAYYLRVLEIPTPRWSTLLALQAGVPLPTDEPATIQQRGWSSPIWYVPDGLAPPEH